MFAARRECSFTLSEVLHLTDANQHRIGSVLSEQLNFGTAAAINGVFFDLLHISPFSKDEIRSFSRFLNDRNLLVHHGGIYTFRYAKENFPRDVSRRVHQDSVSITKEYVDECAVFLHQIAIKMGKVVKSALTTFIKSESIALDAERRKAINSLDYFIDVTG